MNKCGIIAATILTALQIVSHAFAGDLESTEPKSRIEWIADQQRQKARNLTPAKPQKVEQTLHKYVGDNPLNKYMGGVPGLHLRFGGTLSGSGFALGPEYFRPDLADGQIFFRVSAVGSSELWYRIETELGFPHLARRHLHLRFQGYRMDANSVDYYGLGSGSQKVGRTTYRREENAFEVSLALKPIRRYLQIGFSAGYVWLNVGPGKSSDYSSSEKKYSPSVAPGIDRQTNYLFFGPFLELDSRDLPRDPHAGTHFLVRFNRYSDQKYNQYSFQRIEASVEQYLSFFNRKRVIALRVRSALSYPDEGNEIPFYMMPTLGGTSDLRGYRRYRFYDRNLLLVNAEYRWEVFTLMDTAVFVDAGKVFHRDGDFNLKNLESDAGFGFRFKARQAVVFRIDTAFSHEGIGLWLTFNHVF